MNKDWEQNLRDEFRQASLEDSLVDFIGSVDEDEQFEGYGARFNAKCVESITQALKEHSSALQRHQRSVDQVKGALGNIQKLLVVIAISGIALAVGSFMSDAGDNKVEFTGSQNSQSTPSLTENNLEESTQIQNASATNISDKNQVEAIKNNSPNKPGLENDPLMNSSISSRINNISSRIPGPSKTLTSTPKPKTNSNTLPPNVQGNTVNSQGKNKKPNYGGSSISGESAWSNFE